MNDWYQEDGPDVILALRIQPKASRDEIAGVQDGRLKVRITAPPVDGEANRHLQAFLAKTLKVAKSKVILLSGETGREKRVRIESPQNWSAFLAKVTKIEAS